MNNLNKPIANIFINNKLIKLRTNNAIFINLPNHANHIGWWLNKVFVYPSKKYIDYTAIGIKKNNTFIIWKYDLQLQKHQYLKMDGEELIKLYESNKNNYGSIMKKALFGIDDKEN
ncbi:hypothetical protein [Spiroplasma melliferum]|uniref:Plectrovirus spv1-r8a2b orf4 protein n=2 Tax=Spiroplasma melliferum TaxID=2134 RepID=A0AAI9T3W4_SPIME|nr:hypothetical protein [Spiroplasma melliferum]ELL44525.1 plectrovirus SpV1-R8A2B ORF 4 uncharacterized protein [Spiroplasma melliferum IPMB4A]KAI92943.1 plectrovirus spv1-r8a2b orf4 protein [Spiroplasma melliferum KC3]QCO23327.1 Spiroplasmavirus-related protein [Spiroplasma melliferum]QCO23885.1 Spiroplasmavirus-related protein [Spiroplasma melliferum]